MPASSRELHPVANLIAIVHRKSSGDGKQVQLDRDRNDIARGELALQIRPGDARRFQVELGQQRVFIGL